MNATRIITPNSNPCTVDHHQNGIASKRSLCQYFQIRPRDEAKFLQTLT
nr:hypothetical protein [Oligoflexus tunisiensis]